MLWLASLPPRRALAERIAKRATRQRALSHSSSSASPRCNPLNIQMLSPQIHEQVFPHTRQSIAPYVLPISEAHLRTWGLDIAKSTIQPDIDVQLPPLQGNSIAQHFTHIGAEMAEPYLSIAKHFAGVKGELLLPPMPLLWLKQAGWTRYGTDGSCTSVPYPDEQDDCLVFDVEVCVNIGKYPTLAVAVSRTAWYGWVSPQLMDQSLSPELVRFGPSTKSRIIIGHNIGYDRARIHEEYHLQPTRNAFMDTLSLHVACNGMCSQQRPAYILWQKIRSEERNAEEAEETTSEPAIGENTSSGNTNSKKSVATVSVMNNTATNISTTFVGNMKWAPHASTNSLAQLSVYHFDMQLEKDIRNIFVTATSFEPILDTFQDLMTYCATDVRATALLFQRILPKFLVKCPHPVSFAGMLKMASCYLPTTSNWNKMITRAEEATDTLVAQVDSQLLELAHNALRKYITVDPADLRQDDISEHDDSITGIDNDNSNLPPFEKYNKVTVNMNEIMKDDWLQQLDWNIKELKRTKKGQLYKNQSLPNYPEWYRELWDRKLKKVVITPRKAISPLLLALSWNNFPLVYSTQHKWMYRVDPIAASTYISATKPLSFDTESDEYKQRIAAILEAGYVFYKIPHKDGDEYNTGSPFSKPFFSVIESGVLKSTNSNAEQAVQLQMMCSYWLSARNRIKNQFVIWGESPNNIASDDGGQLQALTDSLGLPIREDGIQNGVILPQTLPMGTITRRSVEATWMTASNAKKNRIGSDVKRFIEAPKGWKFVGADVDSEELWISSIIGDSQLGMHGATALGWMNLQGTKSDGTDLHSVTANILNISRNDAKQFNYARIYGAGVKFAKSLLRQFNSNLSDEAAKLKAEELYRKTKGKQIRTAVKGLTPSKYWVGGRESYMFNSLEAIARSSDPRTPVLRCQIPDSLLPDHCDDQFMPSRINWAVQSSGVDYLHLLIVSLEYLIRRYNINARFMLSIHDELRYMVKEEDQYRFAMILQVSNLWTRSLFAHELGMYDLPLSVAFFSAVDIDHCLRKEANDPCITPTNKEPVPDGESLTIYDLLNKYAQQSTLEPAPLSASPLHNKNCNPTSTLNQEQSFSAFPDLKNNYEQEAWLRLQMLDSVAQYQKWRRRTTNPDFYPSEVSNTRESYSVEKEQDMGDVMLASVLSGDDINCMAMPLPSRLSHVQPRTTLSNPAFKT